MGCYKNNIKLKLKENINPSKVIRNNIDILETIKKQDKGIEPNLSQDLAVSRKNTSAYKR